jgi:hypothetical protein
MAAWAHTLPVHHTSGSGNSCSIENYWFVIKKSINGIVNQRCSGNQKQIGPRHRIHGGLRPFNPNLTHKFADVVRIKIHDAVFMILLEAVYQTRLEPDLGQSNDPIPRPDVPRNLLGTGRRFLISAMHRTGSLTKMVKHGIESGNKNSSSIVVGKIHVYHFFQTAFKIPVLIGESLPPASFELGLHEPLPAFLKGKIVGLRMTYSFIRFECPRRYPDFLLKKVMNLAKSQETPP